MSSPLRHLVPWLPALSYLCGCAGGPTPKALLDRTFYEYGAKGGNASASDYEAPYPPLDLTTEMGMHQGVAVLGGGVRFSRPKNWVIQRASNAPSQRFIEYVAPSQVVFALYERVESPEELWPIIIERYRSELEADGGSLVGDAVPTSTWNAQGRRFLVERDVKAPKAPFLNRSREYILRGAHRIVMLQILHQGKTPEAAINELLPVFNSIQVL